MREWWRKYRMAREEQREQMEGKREERTSKCTSRC